MMYICLLQGFMLLCGCGGQRSFWSSFPPTFVRCGKQSLGLHSKCLPVKTHCWPRLVIYIVLVFVCFFPIWIQVFRYLRTLEISLSHTSIILSSFLFFLPSLHPSTPPSLLPRIYLLYPLHFPLCLFFLPASLPHCSGYLFSPSWNYKWHVLDLLYLFYLISFL